MHPCMNNAYILLCHEYTFMLIKYRDQLINNNNVWLATDDNFISQQMYE